MNDLLTLLHKYDVPAPRYTSYPTVPFWDNGSINKSSWKESVIKRFVLVSGEAALYIHLPFCENLCTFCACNKRITINHNVEERYINAVLAEWKMYLSILPSAPVIKEIHLGGGTPTFFSAQNLRTLITGIIAGCTVNDDHSFSIEVHPNYTKEIHLSTLAELGFNRISVGVQDFDPVVQFAINRIQSFETTREVIDWARKYGYGSVNVDLIYGLPHQTVENIEYSMNCIKQLKPDRIALYSYAHVPWKSKVQRRYTEKDLPDAATKLEMYKTGKFLLEAAGFKSIGMDHFALKSDPMFEAAANGTLHRNFMGYTTTTSQLLIGLGVSSISDAWDAFIQNEKVVEAYEEKVEAGVWPIEAGHKLTEEDQVIRKYILDLMCKGNTTLDTSTMDETFVTSVFQRLADLEKDGLVKVENDNIQVTQKGDSFIRNIVSALDARLWSNQPEVQIFSRAI